MEWFLIIFLFLFLVSKSFRAGVIAGFKRKKNRKSKKLRRQTKNKPYIDFSSENTFEGEITSENYNPWLSDREQKAALRKRNSE